MSEKNLLASMALGTVNRLAGDNRSLNNYLDEANANIREGQEIINRQHANILRQDTQIEMLKFELKRMTALREADGEARIAEMKAWRKEHQASDMHDVMGKLKDGSPLRRNTKIWFDAFDAACAARNIRNPEAWRRT